MADEILKRRVLVEFDAETRDAIRDLSKLEKAQDDTSESTQELKSGTASMNEQFALLSGQLGPLPGMLRSVTGGVGTLTKGFKTLRGAIISTGIGALIVALGSLITFFQRTARGQEQLNKVLAGGKAVIDVLLDTFAGLGELISFVFEQPQTAIKAFVDFLRSQVVNRVRAVIDLFGALGSVIENVFKGNFEEAGQAALDAGAAVAQYVTGLDAAQRRQVGQFLVDKQREIVDETRAAIDLAERENNLRRARIAFLTREAQLETDIAELRLTSNNREIEADERLRAQIQAIELTKTLFAERKALLEEEVAILAEQQALGENTLEDNEELARKKAELIRLDQQQANGLRELQERYNSLVKEVEDLARKSQQAFSFDDEAFDAELDKYVEFERKRNEAADRAAQERIDQSQAEAQAELELQQAKNDAILASSAALFGALSQLAGQDTVFGKALAIVQATINTYEGATKALASLPPPASFIAASATIVAGLAAVRNIAGIGVPQPPQKVQVVNREEGGVLPASTGGMIRGNRHSQGGVKFRVGGYAAEAEGGEYIVNRKATARFFPLIDAINSTGRYEHGGLVFQNGGITPNTFANLERGFMDAVKSAPPVLVLEDLDTTQNRVSTTENLARL